MPWIIAIISETYTWPVLMFYRNVSFKPLFQKIQNTCMLLFRCVARKPDPGADPKEAVLTESETYNAQDAKLDTGADLAEDVLTDSETGNDQDAEESTQQLHITAAVRLVLSMNNAITRNLHLRVQRVP